VSPSKLAIRFEMRSCADVSLICPGGRMPHQKVRYQVVNLQIGADCSVSVAELVSTRWQRLPCANLGAAGEYKVGDLDLVVTLVCGLAGHPKHRHDLWARGQHDIPVIEGDKSG
jgi:hypothetical protein